ncbi:hypothetical protein C5167_026642 [Papaver somniferum]|nr:hypothetical protein C5167_026642 [Papaver somniferum]
MMWRVSIGVAHRAHTSSGTDDLDPIVFVIESSPPLPPTKQKLIHPFSLESLCPLPLTNQGIKKGNPRDGNEMEFIVCILLTVLGYIPGIIYVVYVIDHSELGGECSLADDLRRPVIDA